MQRDQDITIGDKSWDRESDGRLSKTNHHTNKTNLKNELFDD